MADIIELMVSGFNPLQIGEAISGTVAFARSGLLAQFQSPSNRGSDLRPVAASAKRSG